MEPQEFRETILHHPSEFMLLAKRCSVSTEIIRKWGKRAPDARPDRLARPHPTFLERHPIMLDHKHRILWR